MTVSSLAITRRGLWLSLASVGHPDFRGLAPLVLKLEIGRGKLLHPWIALRLLLARHLRRPVARRFLDGCDETRIERDEFVLSGAHLVHGFHVDRELEKPLHHRQLARGDELFL